MEMTLSKLAEKSGHPVGRSLEVSMSGAGSGSNAVCMVISSFRPRIGGAEQLTERLSAELVRRGIAVMVITRRFHGLARQEMVSGVLVRRLGLPNGGKVGALTFILHAAWALSFRYSRSRIVHVQNPDAPLLVGLFARILLRRRLFFTVHSEPEALFGAGGTRVAGPLRLRLAARWAEGIIALTEQMSRELVRRGVPSQRLSVLAGGVDVATFHGPSPEARMRSRLALGIDLNVSVYLFAGRLVDVKQVDVLLRAWSLLPPSPSRLLLVVGGGPEEPRLRALAVDLRLSHVRFEPFTDRVLDYLHAADAFVLPSKREGLSVALLEAMATGLPVLASDLPGNRAIVSPGRNGLLFSPGDVGGLASNLLRLDDQDLRHRLGVAAGDTVRTDFSLEQLASRHERLYSAGAVARR
jgi:glycosyltransferase involved in cell wall biosynthesis